MAKLQFADARKYASKAFRREATQELRQKGEALEIVRGLGAWVGGPRSYIDSESYKSLTISKLLITLRDDSSSDDEQSVPTTKSKRRPGDSEKASEGFGP